MTDPLPLGSLPALHKERMSPPMQRLRVATLATTLLVLLPLIATTGAVATGQSVNAPTTVNTTVASGAHDNFAVTPAAGRAISVKVTVTSGGNIDVYVFTPQQRADYENPAVPTVDRVRATENTKSFTGTVSTGGQMYLTVDNEAVTAAGASPSGPVSYTAEFTEGDASGSSAIVGFIVLILIVVVVIALRVMIAKRRAAAAPPMAPGMPGQYPGQPGMPAQYPPQPLQPGQYPPPPPPPPPPQY